MSDVQPLMKITVFYQKHSAPCREVMKLVRGLLESRDNVVITFLDVNSDRGGDEAERLDVDIVPTTVVERSNQSGARIVRGVPDTVEQLLGEDG